MFTPSTMGYDRAITVFSPDGKLYQVEYAFEAVRRGWTTLGIRSKHGVVLAALKKKVLPLMDFKGIEKVFMVDDHVGMTFAGFASDGRVLVDYARLRAIQHKLLYDEKISVELLTRRICDVKQSYTQHAGVRPFGVALIIGGVDNGGAKLFMTEPSGQYMSYFAVAIGSEGQPANEYLEKKYSNELTIEELIKLAIETLVKVSKEEFAPELIEIGYISVEKPMFKKLSVDEISKFVKK